MYILHCKVQEAQETQAYLAIKPDAKWLEFSQRVF